MRSVVDIKDLKFVLTCSACPEQYDVIDKESNIVGYVRLRHGFLYAEYPYVGGQVIYEAYPEGDGLFKSEKERMYHLNKIANKINEKIKERQELNSEEENYVF